MFRTVIIWAILVIGVSAYGDIAMKSVHPDESADYTYNERLSSEHSLKSLAVIESALESFRKLTEAATGELSPKRLAEIGNTQWDMQHLGFVNHVEAIKGTLLKQEYLIKKLEYELAQRKVKSGEMSQRDVGEIQRDYETAEKRFQEFWNTFGIAD